MKVLKKIKPNASKTASQPPPRLADIASKVLESIKKVQSSSSSLERLYKAYDTHQRGMISYDDFADWLLHSNAGVSRSAAYTVAKQLDSTSAGLIDYSQITDRLQKIIAKNERIVSIEDIGDSKVSTKSKSVETKKEDMPSEPSPNPTGIVDIHILEPNLNPSAYQKRPSDVVSSTNQHDEFQGSANSYEIVHSMRRHYRRASRPLPYALDIEDTKIGGITRVNSTSSLTQKLEETIKHPEKKQETSQTSVHYDQSMRETKYKLATYLDRIPSKPQSSDSPSMMNDDASSQSNISIPTVQDHPRPPAALAAAVQLNGNINRLRHALKSADRSGSGYVNSSEFKSTMSKLGVQLPAEDILDLFKKNATKSPHAADIGLGYDKGSYAIHIEDFLDHVNTISSSVHHRSSGNIPTDATRAEERRVLRKIYNGLEKVNDPLVTFHRLDKDNHGYLDPNHLRQGLKHMDIDLSDKEYRLMLNALDRNHDGKISIDEFRAVMDQRVNGYDQQHSLRLQEQVRNHPHYTSSYRASPAITNLFVPEYNGDNFHGSQARRADRLQWTKLQEHFRKNKDKIIRSFTCKTNESNQLIGVGKLDELPVKELFQRLERAGLPLGRYDQERLHVQVDRYLRDGNSKIANTITADDELKNTGNTVPSSNQSSKITIDAFCDVIGLGVARLGEKTGESGELSPVL